MRFGESPKTSEKNYPNLGCLSPDVRMENFKPNSDFNR